MAKKFKQTDRVECTLCKKWMLMKTARTHFPKKEKTYMTNMAVPNFEDLVRKPDYDRDYHTVTKIEAAYDIGIYGDERASRGPCFKARFPLDCTHTEKKNLSQSFVCNIRHLKETDVFNVWAAHASSRQGEKHSDESRDTAQNFLQYATALDLLKNLEPPEFCQICRDPEKVEDDYFAFFVQEDNGNIIKPCNDVKVHAVCMLCHDKGFDLNWDLFKCAVGCYYCGKW